MYKKEIISKFVARGYLKSELADQIESKCVGVTPDKVLVKEGFCSQSQALEVMGEYYGLPTSHVDLLQIDSALVDKFSKAVMLKNLFLPISITDSVMSIAVSNPRDFIALSAIKAVHEGQIKYILVSEEQLKDKIKSLDAARSTSNVLRDISATVTVQRIQTTQAEEILNAPAVKLIDSLINEAISLRASDIHIEPFEQSVRVRYRLDGSLQTRAEFPIESYPAVCARLKILAGIDISERRIPQDGRINTTINGLKYDFRVSTLPTVNGEKLVVRILDKSAFDFTRKELGFTDNENAVVDKILSHPHGIVLLTGPTGCGKSTTLYSFLKELNDTQVNIVTVEDPVEYTLPGVNQTQVNPKANLTFASALRSILRQDPNIIMIGEIRDEETAQIAIRAAITGHLVFSTLHTNDAVGTINRLIDMGVEPYLVSDAVVGVIAQRLVKKLCPSCKRKALTTLAETAILKLDQPKEVYHAVGCPLCNGTGYKGRTAVHEIIYLNDKIRSAINERAYLEELRKLAMKSGMVPLWEACRKLVLDGVTSLSEFTSTFSE